MNQFSVRTRNQNLLRTKTKNFKQNHQESEHRIRVSSSLNNLAGKLYSTSYNEGFSPNKSRVVAKTSNKQKRKDKQPQKGLNPQLPLLSPQSLIKSTISLSMSGLSMRASHISGFAELNTSLLIEKKDLEKRIMILKQAIAHEKKLLNQADYNSKRNINQDKKYTGFYQQANANSKDLNKKINLTINQINQLKQNNEELREKIKQKNQNIERERKLCNEYDHKVKNLKISVMQEEKERNKVKGELEKAQRVMQSASIYCKQLQNERATLLLSINQSVSNNKL